MLTSSRYKIPYPNPDRSDSADVPRDVGACVTAIEKSVMYSQGSTSSRPVSTPATPGIQGRIYFDTDASLMYYDYGTGWMVVGYTEIADRSIPGIKLELGTVTNSEVQDRSLTAVKLVMGTITRDEMADLTINDSKVANRAITGTKLVAGTITSTEIGSRVIASGNIALQAVTTSELQDGSVTSAKINPTLKPSSGAALGTEALRAIGYNAGMAMPGTPNRINVVNSAGVGADFFLTGQRTGEANYRYLLRNDGLIYWGGGGSGVDCWMYRLNLASPMGTGMAIKTASGGLTIDSAAESDRSVLRIGSITWNPSPGDRCIVFDRGSDKPLTPSDGGVLWVDTNGQLCYVGSTGQKHVLAGN